MENANEELIPSNRRKNIRFRTRVPEVIELSFPDRDGFLESFFPAIKIDENIKCTSCVLVTPFDISEGDELVFKESDGYFTPSKIIRVQEIEPTLFRIVFQYQDPESEED